MTLPAAWDTDDAPREIPDLLSDAIASLPSLPEIPPTPYISPDQVPMPDPDTGKIKSRQKDNRKVTYEIILPEHAEGYREPWARLDDESDTSWEYFRYYRDLGPTRTIVAVAEHFDITYNTMTSKHSGPHRWKDRAAAFDKHQDEVFRAALEAEVKQMAKTHSETMARGLAALAIPFQAIAEKLDDDPNAISDLSTQDLRKLLDIAVKAARVMPNMMAAERTARGLPSEIRRVEGQVDHIHSHHADRQQLAQIAEALGGAGVLDDRGGVGELPAPDDTEGH